MAKKPKKVAKKKHATKKTGNDKMRGYPGTPYPFLGYPGTPSLFLGISGDIGGHLTYFFLAILSPRA